MANATYDALWRQAINELSEQLNVEGADGDDNNEGGNQVRRVIEIILQCDVR